MKMGVYYQYLAPGNPRPYDENQDEEYVGGEGEVLPVPNVGDTVSLMYGGKMASFKVLTRHFTYHGGGFCGVNIVIGDCEGGEMLRRLKA